MKTRAAQPQMTFRQRIIAALTGRRPKVLVLVATTHGTRAVPMDLR